ncbi:MAG TPA: DHA2 family efflux MFS transporter permease subunit [Rickettsiales bacterium]|nr:DHA2 family efflux MFS transporter permease subunit [Rickettsiales bacterium]
MTETSEENTYNPWLIAVVVSLAAFMEVLDTTITNVSLSHIAGTLGASQDESTWVLTSYLVANGIVLPLSGWLAGVIGRKRFFVLCIAAFTATSFACGMSTSLGMLIFFRLLQGLSGGGLQPIQQAIILDAFPPEKRGAAFGITGITMVVAPILGPTLGGYITDNFSWQWIFFANVPVGIIAVLLVQRMVQDPPHARANGQRTIDYIGLGLVALGLGALQVVLDKGQQDDWFASDFIITFACISFVCLAASVFWLLKQKDAVVDIRLFANPSFGMASLMMFFVGASLYGGSTLLPLLVQSEYGYDATLAGLILSPGGMFVIFLMPVAGKLVSKFPSRYLVAIGMALCGTGMLLTMGMSPQTDYPHFVMMRIMQVSGLPFLFIPLSTLAFSHIPKEKSNKASAIFAMARNLGGSVGIAALTSFVARTGQRHQTFLASHLSPAEPGYNIALHRFTQNAIAHGYSATSAASQATGKIYQQLLHQSNILSFSEAFGVVGLVMGALALIALFMPYNDPHHKAAPGAAH